MIPSFRSTSISNVAGASLSRRSSERELADSGAKKRISSSTDRQDGEFVVPLTPSVGTHFITRHLLRRSYSPLDIHYPTHTPLHTEYLNYIFILQLILISRQQQSLSSWFNIYMCNNCYIICTLYVYHLPDFPDVTVWTVAVPPPLLPDLRKIHIYDLYTI